MERAAHVHEAELRLDVGTDPTAVGAAVTIELCGAIDHDGPCRWPNNNDYETALGVTVFRTIFVAPETEVDAIHERIASALRVGSGWSVVSEGRRPLRPDEDELATRLAATPEP